MAFIIQKSVLALKGSCSRLCSTSWQQSMSPFARLKSLPAILTSPCFPFSSLQPIRNDPLMNVPKTKVGLLDTLMKKSPSLNSVRFKSKKRFRLYDDLRPGAPGTRIYFNMTDGVPETVPDVVRRFFRLQNGLWIRTQAGRNVSKYKKSPRRVLRLQQHIVCNKTHCRMLDKMVNKDYKLPTYFVDDPYAPYHRKSNLPDYRYQPPKFVP